MTETIRIAHQAELRHAGTRVDIVAVDLFEGYSRARLQEWIQDGSLTVNGETVKPKHRLAGGEWLRLEARLEPEGEWLPENIPLDIIEADEHIIVLNKPAGLVVHPAAGHASGTLLNGLLYFDPHLASLPRAGIVHRLDKDTTGVMVVARSLKAHASLVGQLQDRSMSRVYEAVASGHPPKRGTVDAPIGRNLSDRKKMAVVPSGKNAVTHFRCIRQYEFASHLELSLQTGRTHQIRVHMQHLGSPLLGDPQYGPPRDVVRSWSGPMKDAVTELGRQALHARKLKLLHPGSGVESSFQASLASDFRRLLEALDSGDSP